MGPETMAALAFAMTFGSARRQGLPEAQATLIALSVAYATVLAFAMGGTS
jgi:hypothetical protein